MNSYAAIISRAVFYQNMSTRNYLLDLFTGVTWKEFLDAGGEVSGFRESRWSIAQKIRPGDYLLCYLTGVSRFIGVLEGVSGPFKDSSPIWKDEDFPCRMKVRPRVILTPETAVPVMELSDRLSMFQEMKSRMAWTGRFRGSPAKWNVVDGETVTSALDAAKKNPVMREVDPAKLARRPKALKAKIGSVTVPDSDEISAVREGGTGSPGSTRKSSGFFLRLGRIWDLTSGLHAMTKGAR